MAARGQQVVIGTTPTLIWQMVNSTDYAAAGYTPTLNPNIFTSDTPNDPLPLLLVLPSTQIIFLGGSGVTASGPGLGAAVTGVGSIAYNCVGGDSLYGIVSGGTQTVSLLALRQ